MRRSRTGIRSPDGSHRPPTQARRREWRRRRGRPPPDCCRAARSPGRPAPQPATSGPAHGEPPRHAALAPARCAGCAGRFRPGWRSARCRMARVSCQDLGRWVCDGSASNRFSGFAARLNSARRILGGLRSRSRTDDQVRPPWGAAGGVSRRPGGSRRRSAARRSRLPLRSNGIAKPDTPQLAEPFRR
jgi:hypothetical protein